MSKTQAEDGAKPPTHVEGREGARPRPQVRPLPSALVDQIAAGEVVERPASVVKELVENAIDAGAREVRVHTEQGGVARIIVSDDGHGMDPEDAALALERHATSKIARLDDLRAIRTLGFRGEALPAIASVSRLTLRTRPAERLEGTEVVVEGGGTKQVRVTGCAPGTTVRVDDLFFNVPARRKFLRSLATESGHVGDVLVRFALAQPDLALSWTRDGRRVVDHPPAADRHRRAAQVFEGERLAAVEGIRDGVRVSAMLAGPERARSGASQLYVSVNGRIVRDRALARAVAFAFGSVLPPGRHPVGVVWIELDPERVDVNVHPQKSEVRFADARTVLDAVSRVIAAGLGTVPFRRVEPQRTDRWSLEEQAARNVPNAAPDSFERVALPAPRPAPSYPTTLPLEHFVREAQEPASMEAPKAASAGRLTGLRPLGQVARTYIVCEGPEGLVILDQHAADERIRFARIARAHRDGEVEIQRLLVPERVELSDRERAALVEHEALLGTFGLEVRLLGERTALVVGVPALLSRGSPERMLRDALAEVSFAGTRAFGDAVDTALATMACHAAIRAGDPLSLEEQAALLEQLAAVESFAGHCPHGRPIVHEIAFAELARKVGR